MNSILNEGLNKTWSQSTVPVQVAPHPVSQDSREASLYRYDWINYGTLVITLISSFMLEGGGTKTLLVLVFLVTSLHPEVTMAFGFQPKVSLTTLEIQRFHNFFC